MPARDNAFAMPSPIPEAPPVMNTTFPERSRISASLPDRTAVSGPSLRRVDSAPQVRRRTAARQRAAGRCLTGRQQRIEIPRDILAELGVGEYVHVVLTHSLEHSA